MPDRRWNIVLVEDDATIRGQVKDFLDGESIAGGVISISDYSDFASAQGLLSEHKADVIVLDLFLGAPAAEHADGLKVLEVVKAAAFVPFVIYTAKPDAVADLVSPFVRVVGKSDGGLDRLWSEINGFFELRIPQIHRGIADHMDRSLAEYMWQFVVPNWDELGPLADKPEFVRLLLQRLAASLTRSGLKDLTTDVFGADAAVELAAPDKIHPTEMYIKPAVGSDPLLGDIRVRQSGSTHDYLVVLWPSCDMVSTRDGQPVPPKTDHVLCARAIKLRDTDEYRAWGSSRSNNARKDVLKRLDSPRAYFLPAAWDVPDLLVDFHALEHIPLVTLRSMQCVANVASPYAEALGTKFLRHLGRIGTPDIDMTIVEGHLFT
jgi:CheY-like chemotaxis protein